MTSAEQLLREGRVEDARRLVLERVRDSPSDARARVFLFQLLVVTGEWERALNQLQVLKDLDASTIPMVGTYCDALRSEVFRAAVFAGRQTPVVLGEPEPWIAWVIEAIRLLSAGEAAAARDLRDRAFEAAPATSGQIDGQAFEWIADADSRLGPILEIIANGRYYWVPFTRIRDLTLEKPSDLRDLVWCPARATLSNGGTLWALLPVRYPGSEASDDGAIRLSRATIWDDLGEECHAGQGQRVLITDVNEFPLLEVREIRIDGSLDGDTPSVDAQG